MGEPEMETSYTQGMYAIEEITVEIDTATNNQITNRHVSSTIYNSREDAIKIIKSDLMLLRDNVIQCKKNDKKDDTAIDHPYILDVSKPSYYKNSCIFNYTYHIPFDITRKIKKTWTVIPMFKCYV